MTNKTIAQAQERNLRVVLPKKGRLKEDFEKIADDAGLRLIKDGPRLDYGTLIDGQGRLENVEALVQRAKDALLNINDGIADATIVGRDVFEEVRAELGPRNDLRVTAVFNGCSPCQLWIAAPESTAAAKPEDLTGLRIATSYPNVLRKWLDENDVENVTIVAREGGIEDYVRLGLADAVCDVVDSGKTLEANGLSKTMKLFESCAVMVERKGNWSVSGMEQAETLRGLLIQANENVFGTKPVTPQAQTSFSPRPVSL